MPEEWQRTFTRWSRRAEPYRGRAGDRTAPSRRDEYTFYQALVGAWPFGWDGTGDGDPGGETLVSRMTAYMEKAAKEEKEETSWIRPNAEYDRALRAFVEGVMRDRGWMSDAARFMARLAPYGARNAIGQTLLRLTVPGIPDTYQGSELWNQNLVDPDNRRPVDFAARARTLDEILTRREDPSGLARELLGRWNDGAIKLLVTHLALRVRGELGDVFLHGDYLPLSAGEYVVAFARTFGASRVLVVVPRLTFRMSGGASGWALDKFWGDQVLSVPQGKYRNAFTGRVHDATTPLRLADLLAEFPLALLTPSP
jgi:(1->4)-alpha-D-glucan 1-alpha-D-glucosylmutase